MSQRLIQNNFVGGEISPSLYGRSDLQAYYKGCAKAENFVIGKVGSVRKRRGLKTYGNVFPFVWETSKIIPYHYDRTKGGVLLVRVTETKVVGCIYDKNINSEPVIQEFDIYDNEEAFEDRSFIQDMQHAQLGDTIFLTCEHFFRKIVINDYDTEERSVTVEEVKQTEPPAAIEDFSTATSASASGKTIYYEVVPVNEGVNGDPTKREVSADASWEAGWYVDLWIIIPKESKVEYVLLGKRTGAYYGELTRWYMTDEPAAYLAADKTTVVTKEEAVYLKYTFRDDNIMGGDIIYGQTNVLGENFNPPRCINAFQQRLVLANSSNEGEEGEERQNWPMSMWFSEIGNIYNFYADRPVADDDPFSPTITATGPAFIRWLIPYQDALIAFTDSGIYKIEGSQNEGFSASSCHITLLDDMGISTDVAPISTVGGVTFVGADNKTVYTMAYDITTDSTRPVDRIILATHLTMKQPIVSMALQPYPDNVVWLTLKDGTVLSFTNQPEQEVWAWSRHKVDGAKVLFVISPETVSDSTTGPTYGDLIWAVQKDGDTGFYLAHMVNDHADTIGGVRKNVKATLVTLRPEMQDRTVLGLPKNIKDCTIRLNETGGIAVVSASGGVDPVSKVCGTSGNLFTGDVKIMPRGLVNDDGQMQFISDNDLPCEILSIVSLVEF